MDRFIRYLVVVLATFTVSAWADDWPQWRGAYRTDHSKETGLLKQWPATGPKQVWVNKSAGLGYAGFSVVAGKLFTMGSRGDSEFLIALDANTGKQLWATKISEVLHNGWGDGPRGTPTVDGPNVYALSGQGTLICANAADGKVYWKKTMQELGGKTPNWGYTESPLIDGNQVMVTPGGSQGAIVALNKLTGAVLWQSKEFTDAAQYSSMMAANINGTHQYVQLVMTHFVGVDAKTGKVLWQCDWPNGRTAVIPTPIISGNQVYIASGYGAGCGLTTIGAGNKPAETYSNKVMVNHHGGVILDGDFLYGYSDGKGWTCQNLKTGEAAWQNKEALGKGAVGACADGMLYCLEESSGTVVLIEASSKEWKEHGRFKLDPQTTQRSPKGKIWTHPVIANGKLYLRDQELIFCFNVKKN